MMNNSHPDNIYEKLREHLDRLPVGFSKTENQSPKRLILFAKGQVSR
jgi:hypothetical protein